MCSELTPRAHVPDNRIPQLMQPCHLEVLNFFLPDTSYESEVSNDYAIPPDASTDSLVPPSMHSSSNTMESPRRGGVEKALEKSGYLTKVFKQAMNYEL